MSYTHSFNGNSCSRDIHDGIDSSYLVKMHIFDARTMDGRFSLGQTLKDSDCHLTHSCRERRGFYQRYNV